MSYELLNKVDDLNHLFVDRTLFMIQQIKLT